MIDIATLTAIIAALPTTLPAQPRRDVAQRPHRVRVLR